MTTTTKQTADPAGQQVTEFQLQPPEARLVTGAIWQPTGPCRSTLVCFGHGASGDRYQTPATLLARRFTAEGYPVLSLDGPVHGLRQAGPGGREAFFPEFQREDSVRDMTADWHHAVHFARQHLGMDDAGIAYFGLSMGSLFGIPFIADCPAVTVATLGLVGASDRFPHADELLKAAEQISCPVLFLMQLEDELFDRQSYLRVFDQLASDNKRIHANPGLHPEIPADEIEFAVDFMLSHLDGTASRPVINPLAE